MTTIMEAQQSSMIGLGRRYARDPNDKDFPIRRSARRQSKTFRSWLVPGERLDQGGTSECVIYTADNYLTAHKTVNRGFGTAENRTRIYKEVQNDDEWPGSDYDGTSVRAMCKWLKRHGMISEYRWAFDVNTVVDHVLNYGPVMMGTSWSMDMFMPDRHGYISFTGEIVGGHAWLLPVVNLERKNPDGTIGAVRKHGSWGPRWGQNGRAWITLKDLGALIEDYGEAAVATEIKAPSVITPTTNTISENWARNRLVRG